MLKRVNSADEVSDVKRHCQSDEDAIIESVCLLKPCIDRDRYSAFMADSVEKDPLMFFGEDRLVLIEIALYYNDMDAFSYLYLNNHRGNMEHHGVPLIMFATGSTETFEFLYGNIDNPFDVVQNKGYLPSYAALITVEEVLNKRQVDRKTKMIMVEDTTPVFIQIDNNKDVVVSEVISESPIYSTKVFRTMATMMFNVLENIRNRINTLPVVTSDIVNYIHSPILGALYSEELSDIHYYLRNAMFDPLETYGEERVTALEIAIFFGKTYIINYLLNIGIVGNHSHHGVPLRYFAVGSTADVKVLGPVIVTDALTMPLSMGYLEKLTAISNEDTFPEGKKDTEIEDVKFECDACENQEPNQLAHMDFGGCLYQGT